MPKRVYLIRHGETECSVARRFLGSTDLPLTARGLSQVRRLGERLPAGLLAPDSGTWCVASPLLRAQQTAEAVAGRAGLQVDTDADLREMDFGDWETLTAEEIEAQLPGALWQRMLPAGDDAFPGGESLRGFDERVARARQRIVSSGARTVMVFAHGGVIRALICGLLGLGREGYWLFEVQPASVTRIDLYEDTAVLAELWSSDDGEEE